MFKIFRRMSATTTTAAIPPNHSLRVKNIRKSMTAYLERVRENEQLINKERTEFDLGKRHLANMMGVDVNELDQEAIDDAIKYLFPSGLFDKRARPQMRLQLERHKEAQFDIDGRPHHYLFYTTKPKYYECLHELSGLIERMNQLEDENIARGILQPPAGSTYVFGGREWLPFDDLKKMWSENLSEQDYAYFLRSVNALLAHPYSALAAPFIDQHSKVMRGQSIELVFPPIGLDPATGRPCIEMEVSKKRHNMEVRVLFDGTGQCDIEGTDIRHFLHPHHREGIMFPMQMTGMLNKIDFEARYKQVPRIIGDTAVATCIRYALSMAIASFCPDKREAMRLAGLLTFDPRQRERKKFGQEGARRKYTWKKR